MLNLEFPINLILLANRGLLARRREFNVFNFSTQFQLQLIQRVENKLQVVVFLSIFTPGEEMHIIVNKQPYHSDGK